jgi:hypothetical protein
MKCLCVENGIWVLKIVGVEVHGYEHNYFKLVAQILASL